MKRGFINLKGIVSCFVLLSVMAGSVMPTFASEKNLDIRVITYDEAIQLATKENSSLKEISDNIKYINDVKGSMFSDTDFGMLYDDGTNYLITAARFQRLTSLNSLSTQQRNLRLSKDLTKLSIEAGVKGEMTTISTLENNYELAKDSLELAVQQLSQKSTMYRLGMIGKVDYDKAVKDVQSQREQLKQLEMTIEQEYNSFKKLLGLNKDEKLEIEYEIEYEPIETVTDMAGFVNTKIKSDLGLKVESENVKASAFGLDLYISTGRSSTDYDKQELDVKTAERNYAENVKAKENSIINAYIGLQNTETERKVLENNLAQAKADLETARINYEVGNITKLQYDSANMAVKQAEFAIEQNTLTHDINKFMLDNTCLLQ